MQKIKDMVVAFFAKKYALGWLVSGYRALEGKKTQLAIVLMAVTWLLEVFGIIPKELAAQIYGVLGPIGGMTFLEKLKRFQGSAERVANSVKREAVRG